ncbi:MAG: ceramidase [Cytophagales bacterium]|nr:ceramidase [Cytophagales bacterium]MDW8384538.1 ceramidase domain-containing protein [Flammeovirgaceae bacterium]
MPIHLDSLRKLHSTVRPSCIRDSGPIYTETLQNGCHHKNIIIEPWNTMSAVPFVIVAFYILWKLISERILNWFYYYIAILLFIGGIGGVLYHGFRSSEWYLLMDYVPIVVLCFTAAVYFTAQLFEKRRHGVVIILGVIFFNYLLNLVFEKAWTDNLNYAYLGAVTTLPSILFAIKTRFAKSRYLLIAFFSFVIALFFRISDDEYWLIRIMPFGSHWLWHLFGAVSSASLIYYIFVTYKVRKRGLKRSLTETD